MESGSNWGSSFVRCETCVGDTFLHGYTFFQTVNLQVYFHIDRQRDVKCIFALLPQPHSCTYDSFELRLYCSKLRVA